MIAVRKGGSHSKCSFYIVGVCHPTCLNHVIDEILSWIVSAPFTLEEKKALLLTSDLRWASSMVALSHHLNVAF